MKDKMNKSNIQLTIPKEEIVEERKYSEIIAENFQEAANQTKLSELNTEQNLTVKLGLFEIAKVDQHEEIHVVYHI